MFNTFTVIQSVSYCT